MTYVLMSLREEYYLKMLNGTKKYEYRSRYSKEKTTAFIYISKTKKSIVSIIEFGIPEYDDVKKLYAIPIIKIDEINEVGLEELRNKFNFVVPQSWYYLNDTKQDLLKFLLNRKEVKDYE